MDKAPKPLPAFSPRYGYLRSFSEGGRTASSWLLAAAVWIASVLTVRAQASNNLSVFQFAIYYNSLLEFANAPHTINGSVHVNGDMYVGCAWPLTFNGLVTTTGGISKPAWAGHSTSQYTGTVTFADTPAPGYITNHQGYLLPIGSPNTPDALREIINPPPAGGDTNAALAAARYYNQAAVILLVSNSTVSVIIRNAANDPDAATIVANYNQTNTNPSNFADITSKFPFLSITNSFTDQRENKTVKASQIDVGKFARWLLTNAIVNSRFPNSAGVYSNGLCPDILYVADYRVITGGLHDLFGVRLTNGILVPTNMSPSGHPAGFTLATPNPLYLWGHYNCPNPGDLGTTNTSKTFPASLVSDALTLLSPSWRDDFSSGNFDARYAASQTINAAIVAGIVFSTGPGRNEFSGGVDNLPRYLEDWGNGSLSVVLTLNTSLVNLYASVLATNQYQYPGVYYYAGARKISFDPNFLDPARLPPGSPRLVANASPVLTGVGLSGRNQIQFMVVGVPGFNYAVQTSTNLIDWQPIVTNTSPFSFIETEPASLPYRAYRATDVR